LDNLKITTPNKQSPDAGFNDQKRQHKKRRRKREKSEVLLKKRSKYVNSEEGAQGFTGNVWQKRKERFVGGKSGSRQGADEKFLPQQGKKKVNGKDWWKRGQKKQKN